MSWIHSSGIAGVTNIGFGDTAAIDSFGRLRVSNPTTLFDSQLQYDESPLFWDEALVGGGSTVHDPNNSAINLVVGTANADKVTRQTRQYIRYQPGKSQEIVLSGVLGSGKANVTQRIGYLDDDNGLFFECVSGALGVVLRSSTGGSVNNDRIEQADWNLDKMDGTGPSGQILDPSKSQLFFIDLEWLSVGRVRLCIIFDGIIRGAHEFLNSNVISGAYMTTANLPLRYEIVNTGATASSSALKQICSMVASEGGFSEELGIPHSTGNGITTIGVTTRRPILSMRPKTTFNGIVNRAQIIPLSTSVLANTNQAFIELVYNGTLTNDTFALDPGGVTQADIAADAISGGQVISSFPLSTVGTGVNNRGSQSSPILSKLPLTLDIAGANPIPLSVVVTSFSGTTDVSASLNWKEIR